MCYRTRAIVLPVLWAVVFCVAPVLSGCDQKRPPGYLTAGKVADLMGAETYIQTSDVLIRRDSGGFSAMSTVSTEDLSRLTLKRTDQGEVWVSEFSESVFAKDGTVLRGPAKSNLPYYELKLDSGTYGGVKDTLYVFIGKEKPASWRFKVDSIP